MKHRLIVNLNDDRSRWALPDKAFAALEHALPSDWQAVRLTSFVSSRGDGGGVAQDAIAAMRDAEVYIGSGFPRDLFLAATPGVLRWVHTGSAGVGALLYREMLESDVVITNSAGVHAPAIAETVIAGALYFARGIDFAVHNQRQALWDQSQFETVQSPVVELAGGTMGILGYGGIGREVARRAQALGMNVLATRRSHSRAEAGVQVFAGDAAGTARVLRDSDVVVIAMPGTRETRGLIGAREIALLKRNAVLINVARGNVIDEAALIAALCAGRIRGAALDVFEHEPLSRESPFWQLPNALVLPHISATTPAYWQRALPLILDNLHRYLNGQPLENVVDKTAGY